MVLSAGGILVLGTQGRVAAAPPTTSALPNSTAQAAKSALAPPPGPDASMLNDLRKAISGSGARVGLVVVDLSYASPRRTALNADDSFVAGSTYKFVALMATAERIAAGSLKSTDRLCFRQSEYEEGWFTDYRPGQCYTRQTLAVRAGQYSDNTAGHMLVDGLGGSRVLNQYAQAHGATNSAFFYPNRTTAGDLAALWTAEATGRAGGAPAQQWLYPLLTRTAFESGVPAGVPRSAQVVHKVGWLDDTVNDAALVTAPNTRYVLVIMSDGLGGDPAWALLARLSAIVWAHTAAP